MNLSYNTTEPTAEDNDQVWFMMTIFSSTYFTIWLVYLAWKFMQDATPGHIFEINVLLSLIMTIILSGVRDLNIFEDCTVLRFLESSSAYNYYMSIMGSHIETAIFLKTYTVNTMLTNTAGWICLGMWLGSLPIGAIPSLAMPESLICPPSRSAATSFCDYFGIPNFYRRALPSITATLICLLVMAFMIYRSHQFRKSSGPMQDMELAVIEGDDERRKDDGGGNDEHE